MSLRGAGRQSNPRAGKEIAYPSGTLRGRYARNDNWQRDRLVSPPCGCLLSAVRRPLSRGIAYPSGTLRGRYARNDNWRRDRRFGFFVTGLSPKLLLEVLEEEDHHLK